MEKRWAGRFVSSVFHLTHLLSTKFSNEVQGQVFFFFFSWNQPFLQMTCLLSCTVLSFRSVCSILPINHHLFNSYLLRDWYCLHEKGEVLLWQRKLKSSIPDYTLVTSNTWIFVMINVASDVLMWYHNDPLCNSVTRIIHQVPPAVSGCGCRLLGKDFFFFNLSLLFLINLYRFE